MRIIYVTLQAIAIAAVVYGGYRFYLLNSTYDVLEKSNANLQYEFAILNDKLKASTALNDDLKTLLLARQQEKDAMGEQVQSLSTTVQTLDKLANTDKELLEKYSSVYFLNENYVPKDLTPIDAAYQNRPEKPELIIAGVLPHLTQLLRAATAANMPLQVLSGYRSYGQQSALKSKYSITYGSGTANAFSADQGYSEHQLGTTVDFTTPAIGASLAGLDKTAEYAWLAAHAHEYGFSLSYPRNNAHFVFEPWHWRYVGRELAKKLHDENKALYDLDQRDINTYLLKFFD
ncbi:MAG: M15 family metallopeptidase [bacterium]|nr:M15 family metallopeptidase [bacterium]